MRGRQNGAHLERRLLGVFFAIPILLSSLFILSPSVFAASPSTVYWTNTTRFGQSVSLKYGNEYSGYVHIHDRHGLDGMSGILALGTALDNANIRVPGYNKFGNPILGRYIYFGTLHSIYSAWVRTEIVVQNNTVLTAYPIYGTQSSYGNPSQFPWWVNDWAWSSQS